VSASLRIVLASASPRRLQLLESLGIVVSVLPSSYAEPDLPQLTARDAAIEHARQKCLDVVRRLPDEIVVAADTVVELDGRPFGKPHDRDDAIRMLGQLSGRTHAVHTAFAVHLPSRSQNDLIEEISTTSVTFYQLDTDEIRQYADTGEPLDKAGAYGIQGYGAALVERIDGDFYTVMGFPVGRFVRTLRRLGLFVPITKRESQPR